MKKVIILLGIGIASALSSCASTNANTNTAKSQMATAKELRGAWTLSSINYSGFAQKEVQGNKLVSEHVSEVFDTANPECYINSSWNLVQNNKSGIYTLNAIGSGCPSGSTSKIIWDIQEDGPNTYFIFKDVTGIKPKQNTAGYRLKLDYLSAGGMRLVQDVNVGGKIAQIIYNFTR